VNSGMFDRIVHVPADRYHDEVISKSPSCIPHIPADGHQSSASPKSRPPLCKSQTFAMEGKADEIHASLEGHQEVHSKIRLDESASKTSRDEAGPSPIQLITVKPLLNAAAESWEMDTLSLSELTNNKPLSVLASCLFNKLDLVTSFKIDQSKLERFLAEIEKGYPDSNPYHNRAHAASVLHFMHSILAHGKVAEASSITVSSLYEDSDSCRQLVTLAGLIAAIVHDYEHEGLSNDFLVKTNSAKALTYNDKSPNENHHLAAAFEVLRRPECNFLESLTSQEYREVRNLVVNLLLGTDMTDSSKILLSFKEMISSTEGAFLPSSPQEALLALQMALKCADMGHLALDWNSHMRWVRRLETEFFAQGDKEIKLQMPSVSFLMDRSKPGVSETQVGFFDFVVLPLFREFVKAFPSVSPMLLAVEANHRQWCEVQAEIEALKPSTTLN